MTTEQMDWLDDERAGRHTTAERRKAAAAQGPVILYGTPSAEELAAARGRAGSRGLLVVPEALREHIRELPRVTDEPDDNVSEPASDEHFTSENVGFEDDGLESHKWKEPDSNIVGVENGRLVRKHPGFEDDGLVSSEWSGDDDAKDAKLAYWVSKENLASPAQEKREAAIKELASEVYFDGEGPVDSVSEKWAGETTMAEEPIEDRLRRAFVNGWREGFERGSWGDQRWDR